MWLFLRCDQLKMELKWELRGPAVPLKQQSTRQWREEARARTCGSQLGMLLTCGRRAQREIFKDAAFRHASSLGRGRGVRKGRELSTNSRLWSFICDKCHTGDMFFRAFVLGTCPSPQYQAILREAEFQIGESHVGRYSVDSEGRKSAPEPLVPPTF